MRDVNSKFSAKKLRLRVEVKRIARRVLAESDVTIETLGAPIGRQRQDMWNVVTPESDRMHPITLDMVLAWSRCPDTQEFARRLLIEMLSQVDACMDVQKMRLSDLQRFSTSPHLIHNQIAVDVVRDLAERYGLIPANTTTTAELPIPIPLAKANG